MICTYLYTLLFILYLCNDDILDKMVRIRDAKFHSRSIPDHKTNTGMSLFKVWMEIYPDKVNFVDAVDKTNYKEEAHINHDNLYLVLEMLCRCIHDLDRIEA